LRLILSSVKAPVAFLTLATLVSLSVLEPLAAAPAEATCTVVPPGSQNDHLYARWYDDQSGDLSVGGVRAGIQVRKDSAICPGVDGAGNSTWVGLEEDGFLGHGLMQGGLVTLNDSQGVQHVCRFYEKFPAQPEITYQCGGYTNGDYYYFQVYKYPTMAGNYVAIQDCGQDSSYSPGNCTTKLSGVPATYIDDAHATASAEEQHEYCQDILMGGSSNPANIGNGTHPIEVERDAYDPWIHSESFAGSPQDGDFPCSDFKKNLPNPQTLVVWDDRN
jgi:hypothetical protein